MNRTKETKGTIAVDFDGVIHRYSKGWHDGTIYDPPVEDAIEATREFMKAGYCVYILSTRKPRQIKKWLLETFCVWEEKTLSYVDIWQNVRPLSVQIIPFWARFWNKPGVLGITNRKLPALVYIDDRALKFEPETGWDAVFEHLKRL